MKVATIGFAERFIIFLYARIMLTYMYSSVMQFSESHFLSSVRKAQTSASYSTQAAMQVRLINNHHIYSTYTSTMYSMYVFWRTYKCSQCVNVCKFP